MLCVYIGLLIPWILWGAFQALQTQANSPIDWVSSDFPARQEYDQFQDLFGAADVVVISWDDCKLSNESIDQFVLALRNAAGFFDSDGQWYFQGVVSGREIIRQMTQSIGLDPAEARRRVSGWVLGPDNETTCVVVSFKSSGLLRRSELVPLIRAAAHRYCGADYESLHLAGPVMDGYSVDQASRLAMERYAPLSALITLCMCIICLDSLPAALLVFGVASLCQAISLATIHYCGDTMTALMIIMPPLIQVLAVAGGIHIVNYYFDASKRSSDAWQDERAGRCRSSNRMASLQSVGRDDGDWFRIARRQWARRGSSVRRLRRHRRSRHSGDLARIDGGTVAFLSHFSAAIVRPIWRDSDLGTACRRSLLSCNGDQWRGNRPDDPAWRRCFSTAGVGADRNTLWPPQSLDARLCLA